MEGLSVPLVSVLIPAHNAAGTVGETLRSVAAQTHRHLEIIVVDDGSTDATAMIVEEAARMDPRIRLIRQANAGVAAARNAALEAASGSFIAPLDADDLWHPDKIIRQLRRFTTADIGLVYCWSLEIDEASTVIERRLQVDRFEGQVLPALVVTNFLGNASCPLIRSDLVRRIGGWDPGLRARNAQGCEDWLLYLRLAGHCSFALEPAFLVGYRQSPGAMSRNVGAMWRSQRAVLDMVRHDHPELPGRLFRWSGAEFHRYAANLLLAGGQDAKAYARLTRAALTDPLWIGCDVLARGWRTLRDRRRDAPRDAAPPPPVGQPFGQARPDPEFFPRPSRFRSWRLAAIERLRKSSLPVRALATHQPGVPPPPGGSNQPGEDQAARG